MDESWTSRIGDGIAAIAGIGGMLSGHLEEGVIAAIAIVTLSRVAHLLAAAYRSKKAGTPTRYVGYVADEEETAEGDALDEDYKRRLAVGLNAVPRQLLSPFTSAPNMPATMEPRSGFEDKPMKF